MEQSQSWSNGASTNKILGNLVDYGTAASQQYSVSEIRTDDSNIIQEHPEQQKQQGYKAECSSDDDSSGGSIISNDQDDQNSRLFC
jgi:hypothetical protein